MPEKKYKIIESYTGICDFEKHVRDAMDDGWTPIGGAGYNPIGHWWQAMIKNI